MKRTPGSYCRSVYTIARRYGPRTIRLPADTAHCRDRRRNETATPATFTDRGAYPSTAAVPPRCLASLVAVTDTYYGYERCIVSLILLLLLLLPLSDHRHQVDYSVTFWVCAKIILNNKWQRVLYKYLTVRVKKQGTIDLFVSQEPLERFKATDRCHRGG